MSAKPTLERRLGTQLKTRLKALAFGLRSATRHKAIDIDGVHQLRVSAQRAISALAALRDWLPNKRANALKRQLKSVRRKAGVVRDWDVLIGRCVDGEIRIPSEYLGELLVAAGQRRAILARRLHRYLPGKERDHFRQDRKVLGNSVVWRGPGKIPSLGTQLRVELEASLKSLEQVQKEMARNRCEMHRVRIHCRKLRYTLEFYQELRTQVELKPAVDHLKRIQYGLGKAIDDYNVAVRLGKWARSDSRPAKWKKLRNPIDTHRQRTERRLKQQSPKLRRQLEQLRKILAALYVKLGRSS